MKQNLLPVFQMIRSRPAHFQMTTNHHPVSRTRRNRHPVLRTRRNRHPVLQMTINLKYMNNKIYISLAAFIAIIVGGILTPGEDVSWQELQAFLKMYNYEAQNNESLRTIQNLKFNYDQGNKLLSEMATKMEKNIINDKDITIDDETLSNTEYNDLKSSLINKIK